MIDIIYKQVKTKNTSHMVGVTEAQTLNNYVTQQTADRPPSPPRPRRCIILAADRPMY